MNVQAGRSSSWAIQHAMGSPEVYSIEGKCDLGPGFGPVRR